MYCMDDDDRKLIQSLTGRQKKLGPQLNGLKTGAKLRRLAVSNLPKKWRAAERRGHTLREWLEGEVIAMTGEVSLTAALAIDAAAADEASEAVVSSLLRANVDSLTCDQILACLAARARFKKSRNREIEKLGLDRERRNSIESFYADVPDDIVAQLPPLTRTPDVPQEEPESEAAGPEPFLPEAAADDPGAEFPTFSDR
jgi:hypothetical protein